MQSGGCGNQYAMKSLIFRGQNAIFDTQRSTIFSIADVGPDEKKDFEDWDFTADVTPSILIQDMIF